MSRVKSHGPLNAKIAIVGEAPGSKEELLGRPFVGASGNLLRAMLADAGISMDSCRLLNIMEVRPPGNNFGAFYHDKKRTEPSYELFRGRKRLEAELRELNSNLIICLGNEPLRTLTGKFGIKKWRGTIHKTRVGKCIATYHPAGILRNYQDRPICQIDFAKAQRESLSRECELPRVSITLRPSLKTALDFIQTHPGGLCTFDIETLGRAVRCLGLSGGVDRAISIPFIRVNRIGRRSASVRRTSNSGNVGGLGSRGEASSVEKGSPGQGETSTEVGGPDGGGRGTAGSGRGSAKALLDSRGCEENRRGVGEGPRKISIASFRTPLAVPQSDDPSYWVPEEEVLVLKALSKFFLRPDVKFVAQNFSFDMPILEDSFGLRVRNFYLDTMHAHHLVYPEFPMSLDFLTSVYTNLGYYADYDPANDDSTWTYNGMDCIATHQVIEPILSELELSGMSNFYFHRVHPLVKTLTRVQSRGVLINVEEREEIAKPLKVELKELRTYFKESHGLEFKKQVSPPQVKEVLRKNKIPVPTRYVNRERKETTDERAVQELMAKYPDFEFLRKLLEQREKQKFYGTYVTAKLDDDNRMRTSYNVSGTPTGRISSSQTIWKTGGNLQNIPVGPFRRLFVASPGRLILHADLSQAESRLVAWLSRDMELVDRFANDPDFDVHRFNAARIYGVPESDISPTQRQRGKYCNHSGNYDISWKQFAYVAQIGYKEAKVVLAKHQANPHLRAWWAALQAVLGHNRTIITPEPFNRKRVFYGRLDQETFRAAYNFVPQSVVGDIINEACWKIDAALEAVRAWIILQVHDEIDLEVEESYVETAARIVKNAMEIPIKVYDDLPDLLIPVDLSVGPNWYDQKELKL